MRSPHHARHASIVVALGSMMVAACGPVGPVARPAPFPLPSSASDAPRPALVAPSSDEVVSQILDTALGLRGTVYRLGGDDPAGGFDCSGFVRYVFGQHHLDVPRTVAEQFVAGQDVALDRIRAGDLVFFSTIGTGPTHVGIALGPLSPGVFVHAPGTGSAVRVERFDTPYWRARWIGAKRPTTFTRR